jgi:hypothetical protein
VIFLSFTLKDRKTSKMAEVVGSSYRSYYFSRNITDYEDNKMMRPYKVLV